MFRKSQKCDKLMNDRWMVMAMSIVLRVAGFFSKLSHNHWLYTNHSDELKKICTIQAKIDPPLNQVLTIRDGRKILDLPDVYFLINRVGRLAPQQQVKHSVQDAPENANTCSRNHHE